MVFPGGGVEPGETKIQAIEHEASEEVGIEVRVRTRLGSESIPNTGRLLAYWACEPVSGNGSVVNTEELDLLTGATSPEAIAMIVTSLYPPAQDYLEQLDEGKGRDVAG